MNETKLRYSESLVREAVRAFVFRTITRSFGVYPSSWPAPLSQYASRTSYRAATAAGSLGHWLRRFSSLASAFSSSTSPITGTLSGAFGRCEFRRRLFPTPKSSSPLRPSLAVPHCHGHPSSRFGIIRASILTLTVRYFAARLPRRRDSGFHYSQNPTQRAERVNNTRTPEDSNEQDDRSDR